MSKPDMYMPLILGDFLKDTTRLDTEQQGAYLLLMIEFWLRGPLPTDEKILQKICKFSSHKWAKKSREILEIFSEEDGRLVHRNLMRMRSEYIARHKALSDAGRAGGLKNRQAKQKPGLSEASGKSDTGLKQSYSYSETSNNSLSRAEDFIEPEPAARAGGEGVGSSGSPVNQEAETLRLLLALPHEIEIDATTAARWIEWGLTADQADDLGRIARHRKPTGPIPIKYLETIIQGEFLNNPHLMPAPDRRRRHAQRPVPAEKLSPTEIVAAALRAESESSGFIDGGCEAVH